MLKEGAKQVPRGGASSQKEVLKLHQDGLVPGVEQARGGGMGEVDDTRDWRTQVSTWDFTPRKRGAVEGS